MRSRSDLPDGVMPVRAQLRVTRTELVVHAQDCGAPDTREARPAARLAGAVLDLYVPVTRKGSLTNETVRGSRP
jgi:hypothetical protein